MIYGRKWREYAKQWDTMQILPSRAAEAVRAEQYAIKNEDIYSAIEKATGVPWPMVAVDHRRESDAQDASGNPLFTSYLGNGQPLWIKTTIVPIGRGPFVKKGSSPDEMRSAFITGGLDAYHYDHMDRVTDWRLEKILYYCELFNGAGYDMRGLPSPYLWGGTNIQRKGKFVSDGKFSSTVMDGQLGVAPILAMIMKYGDWKIEMES